MPKELCPQYAIAFASSSSITRSEHAEGAPRVSKANGAKCQFSWGVRASVGREMQCPVQKGERRDGILQTEVVLIVFGWGPLASMQI